jgi:hypothetical protein
VHQESATKGLKLHDFKSALMLMVIVGAAFALPSGCADFTDSQPLKPVIVNLYLNGADPDLTLKLAEGIAILSDPPAAPDELAKAYRSAAAAAQVNLTAGKSWAIVSTGPLLDTPDAAQVHSATLEDHKIRIEIFYTNVRLLGAGFRRNEPWRPLMKLPLEPTLSPGTYNVEVIWQDVDSLTAGKKLQAKRLGPISFAVVAGN